MYDRDETKKIERDLEDAAQGTNTFRNFRIAPDMCQEETPAPKDTPVHPVNGEVHVQDWTEPRS